ncbi:MAG: hypothetical protein HOK52_14065 [Candidatus Marinimicrobia bacterium]|jgi:nitrate reductase assembly molybdenum cofactor insertion protein NarJ|nr:hypothetical protein [Candidatus Neomarinimicrobiota bacterium]MBT3937830.1 hypothetical protein [Candidatus Neomarinimicrobiota bacterium]MBT3960794.1 hypothetical protein [Candidatus Neomarinimicrobiota bacterium]MBT4383187.1 hypothetical protein [Candidatus Neomarinimicrobiota bacterium]MBT4636020.1 hypothetical protein [Candidatus Neomarinimicrobiota bacterium]
MNEVNYMDLVPLISYPKMDIRSGMETLDPAILEIDRSNFQIFENHVNETELTKLQEEFTQLFDFTPNTCLDLGWHLHGENYERGVFMVRIREMLREFNIPETSELPDHLTHILSVLPQMKSNDRNEFIHTRVLPATKKIIKGFGETESPYKNLIQFIYNVLKQQSNDQEGQT